MSDRADPVRQVWWILGLQIAVSVVGALLCLVLFGVTAALSSFVGGAIGFLSTFAYARRILGPAPADPQRALLAHVAGEAAKFGTTVALFALVFIAWKGVAPLPLFLTYLVTLAMFWVALLIDN